MHAAPRQTTSTPVSIGTPASNSAPGWHRLLGGESVDGEILTRLLIHNMLQILRKDRDGALRDIVLTVPASYTSMERKQLKNACEIMDLQVVQLINEPTAAILAYCQTNKIQEGNFLIFHVGASSSAATIYNFTRGIIEVRATSCDHELGSNAVDDLLIQYLIAQFVIEFKARPLIDQDSLQMFERAAVNLKEGLATSNQAFYQIHGLKYAVGEAYNALEVKNPVLLCSIGRPTFNALTESVLVKMLEHIDRAMKAAKLDNTQQITRLLISGEGSRLFSLRDMLTEIETRDGLALLDEFMPARGAALQAGLVCQTNKDLIIWDLLTRPIHVISDGVTTELISINTPLPVTAYLKVPIKDSTVNVRLMQGFVDKDGLADKSASHTDIVINNCPPSLEATQTYGDKQVELAVRVSHDGIISYGARHLGLGVALLVTPLQDVPRTYVSGIERHLDITATSAFADNQKAVRLARKLNLPLFGLNGALVAMGFSAEQISSGAAVYLALHALKSAKRKLKKDAKTERN